MSEHFLLSKAARNLSFTRIMSWNEERCYEEYRRVRFAENDGQPVCPHCGSVSVGEFTTRKLFKCRERECRKQFSVTSGTIFASRKLSFRDLITAILLFNMSPKGLAALVLSQELQVQYKTAFVLLHKMREAVGIVQDQFDLQGEVAVDGAFYGGYCKPPNNKQEKSSKIKKDAALAKRQCMIVMHERDGRTVIVVRSTEAEGVDVIRRRVRPDADLALDKAPSWSGLRTYFPNMTQVNHSRYYYAPWADTNSVESFHSRVHRAYWGVHHHIAGAYLTAYGREMAWREDNRRETPAAKFREIFLAITHHPVSRRWKGYWQRLSGSRPLAYS